MAFPARFTFLEGFGGVQDVVRCCLTIFLAQLANFSAEFGGISPQFGWICDRSLAGFVSAVQRALWCSCTTFPTQFDGVCDAFRFGLWAKREESGDFKVTENQ